jgi:2-methylcitrate dehydratase PrpD
MTDSLSRRLARFAAGLDFESLPPRVIDKAKASLIHGLATSFIGAGTEAGKKAIAMALREESRADGATILTDGRRATRYGAAMANSMLMHTTNQGDSYRMLAHPGACVIPAALATAELGGRSGRDLLAAMIAGYEVECRVAGDFIPSTQARGFRTSPVYGVIGATVAAGKLKGLDEDGMTSAIAWATSFAAGLVESGHAFHEPSAARNGVLAAEIGAEAFAGTERALEGAGGFYHAFADAADGRLSHVFTGSRQTDLEYVAESLGERWETLHIIIKMASTPGFNCPIIELIKDLRREHGIDGAAIESVQIAMNWLETSYPSPAFVDAVPGATPHGGTPFVAAYTAVHGDYPMLGLRPNQAAAEDVAVRELMGRVEVLGVWDRVPFAPRVTLRLRDGSSVTGEYRGDELEWDLKTALAHLTPWFAKLEWPQAKLEVLVEVVSGIERERDVRELIGACVP